MPDTWTCLKCGEVIDYAHLRLYPTVRCPECSEPDLSLYGICGLLARWGGDGMQIKPTDARKGKEAP